MNGVTANINARKERLNLVGDLRNDRMPPRRPFAGKPKPKRWSHQDELGSLVGKGLIIWVNGELFVGTLIEADQFALKFRAEGQQSTVTYFKHTIDSYSAA